MTARRILLGALFWAGAAWAQDIVSPPASLTLDGVAPIPAEVARALEPYGEIRPHGLLSWHPYEREMLVSRRREATTQVHRVAAPAAAPAPLTDLAEPVAWASYQPTRGEYFLFTTGTGGDEAYRLQRYDLATATVTPLGPEGERAGAAAWSRAGDLAAFTTVTLDRNHRSRKARTRLHVVDPARPESARVVATFAGGGWFGPRFSEDGKRLAITEFVSVAESHLWVVEVASGRKRRVTRAAKGAPVSWTRPRFDRDGRALFAVSDRGSEFRRLVRIPLDGGRERVVTGHIAHDVDDYDLSFEARMAAVVTNERGSHALRFVNLDTLKELPRPALVDGVIGGLAWRPRSYEVGFHLASAQSAGDVFSYDVKENRFTRWTNGNNPALNLREFPQASLARWTSFDGREISGFLYEPPASFEGRRPVIVSIHGGPEAQARAGFIGRNNYLVRDLGVAILYPNVRGSTGFGKTFARLDNGRRREDAVRDIGAALDWIAAHPRLDPARVMVMGGSYGGYLSLAVAARHADRIAGAVSIVGISSLVSFLERTESYRRDLRRAEYGDERDPAMRKFLASISPLANAERITRPLFVVQGRNDPRVPHTEAEQIVAAVRAGGTPVWFMMAADEGHGFRRKPNVDYLSYAVTEFVRRTLLAGPEGAASAAR